MSLQSLHAWPAELQIQVFNELLGISESKPATTRKDADAFEIVLSSSGISKTKIQQVNRFISCVRVPPVKEPLTTRLAQDETLFNTFLSTVCDDTYKYFKSPDDLRHFATNLKPWLSIVRDLRATMNIGICVFEDASKFEGLRAYTRHGSRWWSEEEHFFEWMDAIRTLHWISKDHHIEIQVTVLMAEPLRSYRVIRALSNVLHESADSRIGAVVRLSSIQTFSYEWQAKDYSEDDHFALLAAALRDMPVPPTVQISEESHKSMLRHGCIIAMPQHW